MLLADCSHAASLESFHLVAIGGLQRTEHRDVTRLELVRGVRREAAQDDVIRETELKDLKCFMRSKAITNEDSRSPIGRFLGLRVEYKL